jgi:DUF2075 family protein/ABC-type dipeptide/oligopeptide/nickel transport system ATPase subunit
MTDFSFDRLPFEPEALALWKQADPSRDNWPVVYTISNQNEIYVGETVNAATRLGQHLMSPSKQHLERVQIINNRKFNKSVCLDLESQLIKYFAADGKHRVLNANAGITEANYFDRETYRESFEELFQALVDEGLLSRSIPEIVNSNLFKFSPFKSLNSEQAVALTGVLERLIEDLEGRRTESIVIEGDPGTGKTIVAIYLMKLLSDIPRISAAEAAEQESMFSDFFNYPIQQLFQNFKMAIVIPQQALRKTISDVFALTPGLSKTMVMSQFDVGASDEYFDLIIVDEAHRLGRRANQPSAAQNIKFKEINEKLFGKDSLEITQLEWIKAKSRHQVLLLDVAQSIKPADLPSSMTTEIISEAKSASCHFHLRSQMRVAGGNDYIEFVARLLSNSPVEPKGFGSYEFKFCDSFSELKDLVEAREKEFGLSRMLAGYAWEWKSKNDKSAIDIELEGHKLQWNQTITDWVNSSSSHKEMGSIHTIQGYDLNYAGVVIGKDLSYDPSTGKLIFQRSFYFDTKGKEDNPKLGIRFTDDDLLEYVVNIYRVLLTRGIKGTFLYVVDEGLRSHLKRSLNI